MGHLSGYPFSGDGADDADFIRRSYEVIGVAETKTGYRLTCERVEYGTLPASLDPGAMWTFYNHR